MLSFVSTRPVSRVARYLMKEQRFIQDFRVPWTEELAETTQAARASDIFARRSNDVKAYLRMRSALGDHLRSLSLTFDDKESHHPVIIAVQPKYPRTKLKQLQLSLVPYRELFERLSSSYDMSGLTHLSLLGYGGSADFLAAFKAAFVSAGAITPLPLQHIAIDYDSNNSCKHDHGKSLARILQACKAVKSLHIGWEDKSDEPKELLDYLKIAGGQLQCLSLSHMKDSETLEWPELDQVCKACPEVRQFAIQIEEDAYLTDATNECYERFLV